MSRCVDSVRTQRLKQSSYLQDPVVISEWIEELSDPGRMLNTDLVHYAARLLVKKGRHPWPSSALEWRLFAEVQDEEPEGLGVGVLGSQVSFILCRTSLNNV